jgi:hypothetical protein
MSKSLRAFVALVSLAACSGPTGSDKGHNVGDDDDDTNPPAHTGSTFVHVTANGKTVTAPVFDLETREVVGNTEEMISGLPVGTFRFGIGDGERTSLKGESLYVDGDEFFIAEGSVEIVESDVPTQLELYLSQLGKHHCVSRQCNWPYEGSAVAGGCNDMLDEERQEIFIDFATGIVHGSMSDDFGGQGPVVITFNDMNEFTVTPVIDGVEVMDVGFNEQTTDFDYTLNDDAAQFTVEVACPVE